MNVNLKWKNLETSINEKMRFCENIHKKHHDEVEEYKKEADVLDREKFMDNARKATFKLKTDGDNLGKDKGDLKDKMKMLQQFVKRARQDLDEEEEEYEKLKTELVKAGGD